DVDPVLSAVPVVGRGLLLVIHVVDALSIAVDRNLVRRPVVNTGPRSGATPFAARFEACPGEGAGGD
ncbi:hypothetical protein, partial [Nocardia ninae]|uniref:hypothetical protein n=1 Tax=Nocardia ninae TaxID=356145 RepID=UPI0031E49814